MQHLQSQMTADSLRTHRSNLLSALRLCVQTIMDHACFSVVDEECEAFQQLCVTMEHILMFGYRGPVLAIIRKTTGDFPTDFWHVIKVCLLSSRAVQTMAQVDNVKTRIGKCRAWIMTCLTQKSLADDFKKILKNDKLIAQCYDETSLMRTELTYVISGLLVGLESVNLSVCVKGDPRLDCNVTPIINYGLFMNARRSFVGQVSDEDELRRGRLDAFAKVPPKRLGVTPDADETDGGVGPPSSSDTSSASSPTPSTSTAAVAATSASTSPTTTTGGSGQWQRQSSAPPASSTGVSARNNYPLAHSMLTRDGNLEFLSMQRQLVEERNQRRCFEDMLYQKSMEVDKHKHEIEALVNNLEAARAEAQKDREAMQNVILELNEKLCAQDRVLSSLLSRYEDREGSLNADLREAVEMLNSRDESHPGSGSLASPVRNVKALFGRLGKSLQSGRLGSLESGPGDLSADFFEMTPGEGVVALMSHPPPSVALEDIFDPSRGPAATSSGRRGAVGVVKEKRKEEVMVAMQDMLEKEEKDGGGRGKDDRDNDEETENAPALEVRLAVDGVGEKEKEDEEEEGEEELEEEDGELEEDEDDGEEEDEEDGEEEDEEEEEEVYDEEGEEEEEEDGGEDEDEDEDDGTTMREHASGDEAATETSARKRSADLPPEKPAADTADPTAPVGL